MTNDVFICHSTRDKAVAEKACKRIEKNGIRCWIAPRNITPGKEWGGAIIDAINETRLMVLIFSSTANRSQQVRREVERAVSKAKPIIPFRIENISPSRSMEYFVSSAHWLDAFPKPLKKHYKALADTVAKLLKSDGGWIPDDPAASAERGGEYHQSLASIEMLLNEGQWVSCIKECEVILEKALRQLLRELLASWGDKGVHKRIAAAQKRIGQGHSTFEQFALAQLVALYKKAKVFDEIRKQLASNLQKITEIDWDRVVDWNGAPGKRRDPADQDEGHARQMAYWVKMFLYDCELMGEREDVPVVESDNFEPLEKCSSCETALEDDWVFCPYCGCALEAVCEACHRPLESDFRICPYCETPVTRPSAAETDQDRMAKDEYRVLCTGAYIDGVVNAHERAVLDEKRLKLGLSTQEAEKIERKCAPANTVEFTRLVEGVLVDDVISETERVFLQEKGDQLGIDSWTAEQIENAVIASKNITE